MPTGTPTTAISWPTPPLPWTRGWTGRSAGTTCPTRTGGSTSRGLDGSATPCTRVRTARKRTSTKRPVVRRAKWAGTVHLHIFRYADLLLELAEAEVQAGNLENARTIVNQIRARAGQMAQGCGTTTDSLVKAKYPTCATDPSLAGMAIPMIHQTNLDSLRTPWALYRIGRYTTPWTDQQFAWTAVQLERRLELAMEGHRFFDLRRWGIADTTINSYINVEQARRTYLAVAVGGYAARHREYPIPSVQIDLSVGGPGGGLVQNTGW
ncbi:MAG: hypothetical protein DMD34_02005 [Gemmatimonadetes bacterium]|nr:MAG: hypothetical protein DMD34_02005 [Gemmatimonadota bacterium]